MGLLIAFLALIFFIAALAVASVWNALRLVRQGMLPKCRRRVLIASLVFGGILGLYATIGPVRVSSETMLAGFPLPWAVLLKARDGRWVDYPSVYGVIIIFPPFNFVFWIGLFAVPVNLAEVFRRRRTRRIAARS